MYYVSGIVCCLLYSFSHLILKTTLQVLLYCHPFYKCKRNDKQALIPHQKEPGIIREMANLGLR